MERNKWLRCFAGIDGLIFVSSLSEYDQLMREDDNTNRLQDSLQFFCELNRLV